MALDTSAFEANEAEARASFGDDGPKISFFDVKKQRAATYYMRLFPYTHTITEWDLTAGRWNAAKGYEAGQEVEELGCPKKIYWINTDNPTKSGKPSAGTGPVPKFDEEIAYLKNQKREDFTPDDLELAKTLAGNIQLKYIMNAVVTSEDTLEPSFIEVTAATYRKFMELITLVDKQGEVEYPNLLGAEGRDFVFEVNQDAKVFNEYYKVGLRDREKSPKIELEDYEPIDFRSRKNLMPGFNVPEKYKSDWMV